MSDEMLTGNEAFSVRAAKVGRPLSVRLEEASVLTGLPVKRLRLESGLGNLKLTRVGPRTTLVLMSDLEAFLRRARGA